MPSAVIVINSEIGRESGILEELMRFSEVENAYIVYGVYDVIAKCNAVDMEALEELISERIRKVPGVRSTLTLVVSKEFKKG
jgi:DNA-binding Lrp family transcriptional regulator